MKVAVLIAYDLVKYEASMAYKKSFLFLLLVFSAGIASQCFAEFKKTKIAVLDFELRGDKFETLDMGGIVAEWFTTTLVQDGRFDVVERALLKKIINEQKLGMTGLIDENSSVQIGKILGVKTIITGSVLQIGKIIDVNARIINVKTGSIVAAENIRSTSTENLRALIDQLTSKIMKNFPLTGYIVKITNDNVLIDLGSSSGLYPGMKFIVFKEGELIKHPKTGEVLEVEQIRTGLIQIDEVRANVASARILKENPGHVIEYGQLVQSTRPENQQAAENNDTGSSIVKVLTPQKKQPEPQAPSGYTRTEFSEGLRDNLATGDEGPPFLAVKTGNYMMGGKRFPEKPQHLVTITRPFELMVHEVTFDDFDKFCLDTGFPFPDDHGWGRGERPVIDVSWEDSHKYAEWLSEQTGNYYRLPTESEWEWAAGAGTNSVYLWGDRFKMNLVNCKECTAEPPKRTLPVRSFPPNRSGFYDMAGNVWEWVEDCWAESYVNAPEDESARKYRGKCGNRTIRGGAWNSPKKQITATTRLGVWSKTRSNYIGFRLVKAEFVGEEKAASAPRIYKKAPRPKKQETKKTSRKNSSPFISHRGEEK